MSDAMSEKRCRECEACGTWEKSCGEHIRVRTTNGGLCLCRQCLDDINRKNPDLAAVRAELVKAKDDAEATWLNTTANMVRRDQYEFVIEKCNTLTAERDEAVSSLEAWKEATDAISRVGYVDGLMARAERAEEQLIEATELVDELRHFVGTKSSTGVRAAAFLARHRGGEK